MAALKIMNPNPCVTATNSAAINARQPKPNPRRIPVTMPGKAPGNRTSRNIRHRDAPRVRIACSYSRGTLRTPTSVLKNTVKKMPFAITNRTVFQVSPNQVMAKGSHTIPERALKNPASGSTKIARARLIPTSMPRAMPALPATAMPTTSRARLMPRCPSRVRSRIPSARTPATATGEASANGFTHPPAVSAYQTAKRAPKEIIPRTSGRPARAAHMGRDATAGGEGGAVTGRPVPIARSWPPPAGGGRSSRSHTRGHR